MGAKNNNPLHNAIAMTSGRKSDDTNCKNCGAPLKGNCEYCGTMYGDDRQIVYNPYLVQPIFDGGRSKGLSGNMYEFYRFSTLKRLK